MIEYLLSPDTVDEWIWESISKKLNVLAKVGLSKEKMSAGVRSHDQMTLDSFFTKKCEEDEKVREKEKVNDNNYDDDDIMII